MSAVGRIGKGSSKSHAQNERRAAISRAARELPAMFVGGSLDGVERRGIAGAVHIVPLFDRWRVTAREYYNRVVIADPDTGHVVALRWVYERTDPR